jgi:hypothetical protein
MSPTGLASSKDLRKSVQFVLSKCFLGDWFVLAQIGKNVNTYFYRAFLKELSNELKEAQTIQVVFQQPTRYRRAAIHSVAQPHARKC